jgi:hypothetical protein
MGGEKRSRSPPESDRRAKGLSNRETGMPRRKNPLAFASRPAVNWAAVGGIVAVFTLLITFPERALESWQAVQRFLQEPRGKTPNMQTTEAEHQADSRGEPRNFLRLTPATIAMSVGAIDQDREWVRWLLLFSHINSKRVPTEFLGGIRDRRHAFLAHGIEDVGEVLVFLKSVEPNGFVFVKGKVLVSEYPWLRFLDHSDRVWVEGKIHGILQFHPPGLVMVGAEPTRGIELAGMELRPETQAERDLHGDRPPFDAGLSLW